MHYDKGRDRWAWDKKACQSMAWELSLTVEEKGGQILIDGEPIKQIWSKHPWINAYLEMSERYQAVGHRMCDLRC